LASTLASAYNNLSTMLQAGMPLGRSLRAAASGATGILGYALADVTKTVAAGNSLAEAMAKHPKIFAPLDVLMVQVGETSGDLPDCLRLLAQWYDLVNRQKRIILSGMILPVLLIHAAALICPLPAFLLGWITAFEYLLQAAGIVAPLYIPVALIVAIIRLTPKTGPLRQLLDTVTFKIPLLGRAIRNMALSRYCRASHMLLRAGVPAVQTAQKAAEAVGNTVVEDMVRGGVDGARAGKRISDGFSRRLPKDFLDAWRIGEESGMLDDTTRRLADTTAEAAEWTFVELARWVPRLVYVFVSLLLIAQIFSFVPMLSMSR